MQYYQVGKIVNTHGIKGEVKVLASTDFKESRLSRELSYIFFKSKPKLHLKLRLRLTGNTNSLIC